jgi:myo-inositol-1(or 4)-monophosphatase
MRPPVIMAMEKAALNAAQGLVRDFGEIENLQTTSLQSLQKFVFVAEKRTEKILCETLSQYDPGYSFLVEGSGLIEGEEKDAPLWIIDPLDGTKNFCHGLPNFAISIALKEKDQLTAALVYDPLRRELFWAYRNMGAFLNQTRLRVSQKMPLESSIIAVGTTLLQYQPSLTHSLPSIRLCGAVALDLAYVASARYQGLIGYQSFPWDIAAGVLLIKEAGGFVSDYQGKTTFLETGNIIAGNDLSYKFLLKEMDRVMQTV